MTQFRAFAATAAVILDQIYGEPFNVKPMAMVSGKWIADPARAPTAVTAVLTEKSAFSPPIGQKNLSGMSKGIVSEHATMFSTIDIARAALPYALRAKDRLVRAADSMIFEIEGVENDDLDHVTYRVAQLGPLA